MNARKTSYRIGLIVLASFWTSLTYADQSSVYESLDDVQIGSVFFSPVQRSRLDKKRNYKGVSKARRTSGNATSGRKIDSNAAGYIVGRSGKERIYVRGDFVAGAIPSEMTFPGDVKITKTIESAKVLTADAVDENRAETKDETK